MLGPESRANLPQIANVTVAPRQACSTLNATVDQTRRSHGLGPAGGKQELGEIGVVISGTRKEGRKEPGVGNE